MSGDSKKIGFATGAMAWAPSVAGDCSVPILTGDDSVDPDGVPPGRVLLVDEGGYTWAAAMAESLLATGRPVTIVTRFFEAFRELPIVSRIPTLREVDRLGGTVLANTEIASVSNGAVTLRHYTSGREDTIAGVAAIVWTGAAMANGGLADGLLDAGFPRAHLHVVGDAFSPRRLVHALGEGHAAGRKV